MVRNSARCAERTPSTSTALQVTRQFCAIHTALDEHSPRAARLAQLLRLSSTSHRSALPQGQAQGLGSGPLAPAEAQGHGQGQRQQAWG
jgi:hypothetical protein